MPPLKLRINLMIFRKSLDGVNAFGAVNVMNISGKVFTYVRIFDIIHIEV